MFHQALSLTLALLLLCGVSFADTTSNDPISPHDPAGHGPELHQELAPGLFCLASYVLLEERIFRLPDHFPEDQKTRIAMRRSGLAAYLLAYYSGLGHDPAEVDPVFMTMLEDTRAISERDFDLWVGMVRTAQCAAMTQPFVNESNI